MLPEPSPTRVLLTSDPSSSSPPPLLQYVTHGFEVDYNPLTASQIVSQVVTEKRPLDTIAIGALARVLETVGLSLFLTYWGTRTNPFD